MTLWLCQLRTLIHIEDQTESIVHEACTSSSIIHIMYILYQLALGVVLSSSNTDDLVFPFPDLIH